MSNKHSSLYTAILAAALTLSSTSAHAGGSSSTRPSAHHGTLIIVSNTVLGVALRIPWGLMQDRYNIPKGEIDIVNPTASPYNESQRIRLVIASGGTTPDTNNARAATASMAVLLHGAKPLTYGPVNYGGATGVEATGVPSNSPVTAVVIVHANAVYKILAPGTSLGLDQRQMLASLHFIRRQGAFPASTIR